MTCPSMLPKVPAFGSPTWVVRSRRGTNGLQCLLCCLPDRSAPTSPLPWRRLVSIAAAGAVCALVILALGYLTERNSSRFGRSGGACQNGG